MYKKVLITGGAGFIGSSIAKHLANKGLEVKTFDIVKAKEQIGEHIIGSIMSPDDVKKAMQGCDAVVHLAAMLGVKRTEIKRMECLDINIFGTKNILEASYKAGVKKIVFASSSEVYGEPIKTPIKETDPVSPKSVYGITKLAGEEYMQAYKNDFDIDYTIIRFFNVYGPGQVAEFVAPRFIKAVLENKPPVVYGEGNQTRSFCYVDDAAEGVYLALTSEKANSQIFNIGNDNTDTSMKELAEKVIEISQKNLNPIFIDMEKADRNEKREIKHRTPDITKAKTILNYQPKITLEQGIKKIIGKGGIQATWFDPMIK